MTQEQKINRGTIIIFVLSIILVMCLCASATLAYFAGQQSSNVTLVMGGPVRVTMVDKNYNETYGAGNMVMNIKADRDTLLPGIGIDMQAIAKLTSSTINPTPALLRAILDVDVEGVSTEAGLQIENLIRKDLGKSITPRVDVTDPSGRPTDGWVLFDDGYYYYCSKAKEIDPNTNQEYIAMCPISTGGVGNSVAFINGTFAFPGKEYTNIYANVNITFKLTFQAIQDKIVNDEGERIPNTIFNVKQVLDSVDWSKHNN